MKYSIEFSIIICLFIIGCSQQTKKDNQSNIDKNKSSIVGPKNIGEKIFVNAQLITGKYAIIEDEDNNHDIFIVKKGNRFGLINNKNQIILSIEYDTIVRPHLANYFYVTKNNLTGVVTFDGFLTIPFIYEHIEYDWKEKESGEEDCFIVQKNKKLGSIDFHNNIIIPIEYDGISNWVEYGPNAHYVKKEGLYGLANWNSGKLIIPVIYDGLEDYKGCIKVKKNGRYGVLSWENKVIVPCVFDRMYLDLDYFDFKANHKDRIFARKNNVWYEFETNGNLIRPNVPTNEINKDLLEYIPDSDEFRYHLKDCMTFPFTKK